MYKANRAIIMAAGKGTRLYPLTQEVAKPLIKVHGVRMVETIIDGLHQNGITDIGVVIGYKKEQFAFLEKKYDGLRLIENPYYDQYNNISSLYVAREYLGNCIIIDGDQILKNTKILHPDFEKSGYCSVWVDEETDEWLQTVEDGKVVSCSRNGGSHGWQLYGVSYWNEKDGKLLKELVEKEFVENRNKEIYWDDLAMFLYADQFDLGVKQIAAGDIVEIDNLKELIAMDASYQYLEGK